ncbi:MAG: 3-phosphoglycerate dehydrogenase, partial [Clostridia bacterium]|nr:3-phosphoglycerate dehydrogenase [Clostridia bacterium]
SLPHASCARVCVMHKNVPNMLSPITAAFSSEGINIENMASGSKGEIAYTILETTMPASAAIVEKIGAIDGVIKVLCY